MNLELETVATELGIEVDDGLRGVWSRLGDWLHREAIPAGAVGRGEGDQIETRHLADSLLFAAGFAEQPPECWDLGTGAGLPGLVLASIWPETAMILVDSSARRCDLARRGARVAGIRVTVENSTIEQLRGPLPAVVSRAAIPPERFYPMLLGLLSPGGRAVVSGGSEVPEGYHRLTFLDQPTRLLIMQAP